MAEMTAEYEEVLVPEGGVADFLMSDEDLNELERQEAERSFGGSGIAEFGDVAQQMAALGRYGDDSLVHAQTGEIVVPREVLESNPALKQAIFDDMMARGIEDPERYVVGSESNSINPETGLMEFGFFKGVVRSVKRAVSSVAKSVKKVVKKVAPIVLPIALAMTPLGPVYGAALGSGIATLIQGGSFKDALKSAAISGLSGAAFQGVSGPGTFSENISNAFADPGARFSQTMQGITGPENFFRAYTPTPSAAPTSTGLQTTTGPSSDVAAGETIDAAGQFKADVGTGPDLNTQAYFDESIAYGQQRPDAGGMLGADMPSARPYTGASGNQALVGTQAGADAAPKTFSERVSELYDTGKSYAQKGSDLLFGKTPTGAEIDAAKLSRYESAYQSAIESGKSPAFAEQFATEAMNSTTVAGPSFLRKFGPTAALVGGATYLMDGFETPPEEDPGVLEKDAAGNVITGADLLAANPEKYMVNIATAEPTYFQPKTQFTSLYSAPSTTYQPQTTYTASLAPAYQDLMQSRPSEYSPFFRAPVQMVKNGGEIFPRRTGGIMPDEGIPGKDSVRAMLMPGEFVMTTDAVKGAGGGDLNRGINRMYDVMANLERKGRMA